MLEIRRFYFRLDFWFNLIRFGFAGARARLSFGLLFVLYLTRLNSVDSAAGRKVVFGVVGSSVLLDPEYGADLSNSEILWEFTASNKSPVTILDYMPNHHTVEPRDDFKSRLYFNPSDGSLMVNNLKPSDQGVYTVTVDTSAGAVWKRSEDLQLIEPLSEPQINVTDVESTIELICQVSVGKASAILWMKDDEVIMNDQRYQLVENNSKLIISEVKTSVCGKYTCTVENPVSKKNNSYYLSIHSLALAHHYTVAFSVVALIIAAIALIVAVAALIAIVAALLTEHIKITSLEFVRNILQIFQFTPMLTFILLVAYICWILAEGLSGITVYMWVLFCLHLILTVLLACNMMACDWERLNMIWKPKFSRLMLQAANLLGGITVICASGNLIAEIMKQAGKGCEPAANLQSTIIRAVVGTIVFLVVSFALYLAYTKWKKRTTGPLRRSQFKRSRSASVCLAKGTSLNPGATAIGEELP